MELRSEGGDEARLAQGFPGGISTTCGRDWKNGLGRSEPQRCTVRLTDQIRESPFVLRLESGIFF